MKPVVTLSTALAFVLLAGCNRHPAAEPAAPPALPPMKVRVVTVRAESLPMFTEITGTIRPVQRAQIAAKLMGVIEKMPLTLGQRVQRGDTLVTLSAGEINARVAQAQSQLNQAQRDLERERSLLTKGASMADTVRGLEDRFAAAQAMVREAEVMLGYTKILAPFDGVVARKLAQAGDLASPGATLLELEGTTGFEVEAGVPDSLAAALTLDTSIPVAIPAAGLNLAGKLAEFSSTSDSGARTVAVKIALPSGAAVRSGQFARIQIPVTPTRVLLAPAAAVSTAGQMERIFVAAADNRAVLRLVKTGAARGDSVEILSGLDDGERIVVGAPAGLREGQPLEILP